MNWSLEEMEAHKCTAFHRHAVAAGVAAVKPLQSVALKAADVLHDDPAEAAPVKHRLLGKGRSKRLYEKPAVVA